MYNFVKINSRVFQYFFVETLTGCWLLTEVLFLGFFGLWEASLKFWQSRDCIQLYCWWVPNVHASIGDMWNFTVRRVPLCSMDPLDSKIEYIGKEFDTLHVSIRRWWLSTLAFLILMYLMYFFSFFYHFQNSNPIFFYAVWWHPNQCSLHYRTVYAVLF